MKLAYEVSSPGRVHARVGGDLEVASCTCLQNFWELRLQDALDLELDLSGVEAVDPDGLSTLVALLVGQLEAGARVLVRGADARLVQGLGALADAGLRFADVRE
jgi:ABC-type transporter Mla MlaB component